SEVKGYSDVYFQPRAEALVTKKRKMEELKTEKLETNMLKSKENMVNNWFNMTEEERYQRDTSSLETPSRSEDKIEGFRKFTESELGGMVSYDMGIIVMDIDPKPQNAINSLESEEVAPDAQSNKPIKTPRKWTSFFTQLRRGQATFSKYTPRIKITTKNNNALIFDIRSMNDIQMNDIISTLYNKIDNALVGAKPHYTKGKRTYLELVFNSEKKQQYYAKEYDTNEEQNIENNEESSSSMQDIADRDVEILSQEGESLDIILDEDRNEKNQQKAQMNTNSADINVLNIDHKDVQAQVQENNVEKQADDGFIIVTHKKVKIRKSIYNSRSKPYVSNRPSQDGRNK
ncbi:21676_t:CDS:2, partial [Racocetra persica]